MSSRIRPVEKLARATAQCSTEVSIRQYIVVRRHRLTSVRRPLMENASWVTILQCTRICVPKNS